jgi:hypothetical protein
MSHDAVCLETKLLVPDAKIDEVASVCHKIFKEMGLNVIQSETSNEGSTTVLAGEGALLPMTVKTLLFPFSLQQFIKAAQRSGVHVVISPSKEGTIIYSCGLAIDEFTGKPAKFASDEEVTEITNTMEALDFENKFLKKIRQVFPSIREME